MSHSNSNENVDVIVGSVADDEIVMGSKSINEGTPTDHMNRNFGSDTMPVGAGNNLVAHLCQSEIPTETLLAMKGLQPCMRRMLIH